ncbi:hypothetical protein NDU88_003047 [Pleurodeles waltl]|uniref:Uncharacterized protein n=1 Tax=Pleurodeles waltl TaxID=8319 RepID=A0AAV7WSF8_PLEWA|nr:hypothetical protein NDU88_003047 [Pleurodeles waltl]
MKRAVRLESASGSAALPGVHPACLASDPPSGHGCLPRGSSRQLDAHSALHVGTGFILEKDLGLLQKHAPLKLLLASIAHGQLGAYDW